ncbi:MAG: 50S ribosomal protein L7/L12 [Candidatus Paceibacterota bacterium]
MNMSKFDAFMKDLESASVLELNDLVKAIEEKFGVSAQAVAVAGPAAGAEAAEEKSSYTVVLAAAGEQKIAVMKIVKEVLGLGLKEAKDLVDGAPTTLKDGMKKAEAEEVKKKIEEAGGKVELK